MKKLIFFPIIGVFVIFAVLAGCSKDEQLMSQDSQAYYKPGSNPPELIYGSMKGKLEPVPSYASILLKSDMGYTIEKDAYADGSFWFGNLPAGNYYMKITYVVSNAGFSYITSHELERLKVEVNEVTEMGSVQLPWSY